MVYETFSFSHASVSQAEISVKPQITHRGLHRVGIHLAYICDLWWIINILVSALYFTNQIKQTCDTHVNSLEWNVNYFLIKKDKTRCCYILSPLNTTSTSSSVWCGSARARSWRPVSGARIPVRYVTSSALAGRSGKERKKTTEVL